MSPLYTMINAYSEKRKKTVLIHVHLSTSPDAEWSVMRTQGILRCTTTRLSTEVYSITLNSTRSIPLMGGHGLKYWSTILYIVQSSVVRSHSSLGIYLLPSMCLVHRSRVR